MPYISPESKAKEIVNYFNNEKIDYNYIKKVFMALRKELNIKVTKKSKRLPYVPTDKEIINYWETINKSEKIQDKIIIKILLYTGVRVSELINIKLEDINYKYCQIKIIEGKGKKDRVVPFPKTFKKCLTNHTKKMKEKNAIFLFESSRKKKYTDRGIRKILAKYSKLSGLINNISPHKLRHFLMTWLKRQGVDDSFIQPFSGHESRKSLEVYSKLTIVEAQLAYDKVIKSFPV
jgi:integrase/recombinase XerD